MTDSERVGRIADEHYARVLDAAYHLAKNRRIPDADNWAADMTQSTFLKLNEPVRKKKLRAHKNIAGWLIKALKYTADDYQQKTCNQEVPFTDAEPPLPSPPLRPPDGDLFPDGLTEGETDLLYRCHCEGIPRKEVAASLGISTGACQMRLERAEERFRTLRERERRVSDSEADAAKAR